MCWDETEDRREVRVEVKTAISGEGGREGDDATGSVEAAASDMMIVENGWCVGRDPRGGGAVDVQALDRRRKDTNVLRGGKEGIKKKE